MYTTHACTLHYMYCALQHYTNTHYTLHTHAHTHTHTYTSLTLTGLSEDNSRVLDPKNWTNDTTSARTIMLVPSEIPFSAKKSTVKC